MHLHTNSPRPALARHLFDGGTGQESVTIARIDRAGESPASYREPMTSVKQVQVTFDCAEPARLARFWCQVLGYEQQGSACADPSGVGPRLYFQRVPESKVVKNRLHLDVRVGTGLAGEERVTALEAECARLVALGAVRVRLLPADDDNESCLVMQDIEGNEFCLD